MIDILLLHGAVGSAGQFDSLKAALQERYNVHTLNFMGHGGEPISGSFSIEKFAGQLVDWVQKNKKEQLYIIGYSMGGYVAMYAALHHPGLADKIITLGTKYHWDAATAEREVKMLDPVILEIKVPAFAKVLQARHHPTDWKEVLIKTAEMLLEMGNDNPLLLREISSIKTPCLLLLGDKDKMVTLVETFTVYNQLPNVQLGILPGTPHAIEQVDMKLLLCMINKFLEEES